MAIRYSVQQQPQVREVIRYSLCLMISRIMPTGPAACSEIYRQLFMESKACHLAAVRFILFRRRPIQSIFFAIIGTEGEGGSIRGIEVSRVFIDLFRDYYAACFNCKRVAHKNDTGSILHRPLFSSCALCLPVVKSYCRKLVQFSYQTMLNY